MLIRKLLLSIFLAALIIGMSAPGLAQSTTGSCVVGNRPAATLLIPYFEVELDDPSGRTTLFAINNAASEPALARAILWTDCHLPVLAFDLFLDGNDVVTVNLRDVLTSGILPVTSPEGAAGFPSCTSPLTNPSLDSQARTALQAQLTGKPSPVDGLCYGSERPDDRVAVGFVTVDVLNDCSTSVVYPDDPGYFEPNGTGLASNDNALWGDFFLVDTGEDFAQGFEAVTVVADAERFVDGDFRSFYQVTEDERDDRLPISSRLRARFLNGGIFTSNTELIIWAQRSPALQPFTCGMDEGKCPLADNLNLRFEVFDEEANMTESAVINPRAFVSKIDAGDLTVATEYGFIDMESTAPSLVGPAGTFEQRQAWMLQISSAENQFSVGLSASRLDDLCQLPAQGE